MYDGARAKCRYKRKSVLSIQGISLDFALPLGEMAVGKALWL
jgi:hypothetical protein